MLSARSPVTLHCYSLHYSRCTTPDNSDSYMPKKHPSSMARSIPNTAFGRQPQVGLGLLLCAALLGSVCLEAVHCVKDHRAADDMMRTMSFKNNQVRGFDA